MKKFTIHGAAANLPGHGWQRKIDESLQCRIIRIVDNQPQSRSKEVPTVLQAQRVHQWIPDHFLSIIANMTGCVVLYNPPSCMNTCQDLKYRLITGACNNRNHPSWGASNTVLSRWLPSQYEDGFSEPKGWNTDFLYMNFSLPQVREVTNKIIHASNNAVQEDSAYSHIIIEWGQYIDHDMAFTPQSINKVKSIWGSDCHCANENQKSCFPIMISTNDSISQSGCIPFYRSLAACGSGDQSAMFGIPSTTNPREQINGLTSFIDASTVYGSTAIVENKLRNHSSEEGLLRVNLQHSDHGQEYMPFVDDTPSPCIQDPNADSENRIECFFAGETRSNEVTTLAAMHTLWLREHNRVARALKNINPQWSSETTYQETRKIVGALHQVFTIRDYIPKILGLSAVKKYIGIYQGYNENINPSISNIFSTAAFRFGHATIPPVIHRLDSRYREHSQYPSLLLNEVFFRPWRIIREGGLDPLIRGLIGKPAKLQTQQEIMNEELTEKLLVLSNNGSMDLASLNLQRGRDHGLPGYNNWREFCGLPRLNSTLDMKTIISDENITRKMLELYGHPDNIDVWLGGLLEDLLPGGRTGPLFACLIGMQIRALRDGDRFWYESTNVFTEKQKLELERHSLSRVICDNTGLTQAPLDSFLMENYPEGFESCDNIPSMNLEAWKENQKQGALCGLPKKIENGDFVYCSETLLIYFCYPGYRLVGNEKLACLGNQWNATQPPLCKDVDECSDWLTPPCHASATCRNTLGSYDCLCTDPYELAEDKRTYSGKLPRASIASIILVALLFLSWAVMCWFLVCRSRKFSFTTSADSHQGEDLKKISILIDCSKCHTMSLPSMTLEPNKGNSSV
ncbi:thyroid peroxidase [Phyllobates terribilis]|uniref:thyroid peroxidase n=1 Tax=Phyllobates terribilis TaxID=111132 RepID=UPI003CCB3A9A